MEEKPTPDNQLPTPSTGKWPEKSMPINSTPGKAMQIEVNITTQEPIQATIMEPSPAGSRSRIQAIKNLHQGTREPSPGNRKAKPSNQEASPGNHGTREPNVRSQEHSPSDHGTKSR